MERINIPASLQNLTNVDKVQQKVHSDAAIFAQQNSEIDEKRNDESLRKPNEIDEAENQLIDPDEKREKGRPEQKKKKRSKNKPDKKNRGRNSGKFVDYSA